MPTFGLGLASTFGGSGLCWGLREGKVRLQRHQSKLFQRCKGLEPARWCYLHLLTWEIFSWAAKNTRKGIRSWLFALNTCCPLAGGGVTDNGVTWQQMCAALTSAFVTAACDDTQERERGEHVLTVLYCILSPWRKWLASYVSHKSPVDVSFLLWLCTPHQVVVHRTTHIKLYGHNNRRE